MQLEGTYSMKHRVDAPQANRVLDACMLENADEVADNICPGARGPHIIRVTRPAEASDVRDHKVIVVLGISIDYEAKQIAANAP